MIRVIAGLIVIKGAFYAAMAIMLLMLAAGCTVEIRNNERNDYVGESRPRGIVGGGFSPLRIREISIDGQTESYADDSGRRGFPNQRRKYGRN
ncbi:MAG: hypothetical protein [Microviridae sp.]|nr:MAG: hypothetical protein [Microviridae sp.]